MDDKAHLNASLFFIRHIHSPTMMPTQQLHDNLTHVRSLYGAGLGFASLGALTPIVRATLGLRWEPDGVMADILAVIDADIGQAIQASVRLLQEITSPDESFSGYRARKKK